MERIIILFTVAFVGAAASAQFAIDWFTVDGGGGTSTNQMYVLSGTIGQPDAGPVMTGNSFTVQGGFWPGLEAIQTPSAPWLSISGAGGNVLLSWNPGTPGFILQQSTTLAAGSWQNAPSGPTNPVIIPRDTAYRFYRLVKP
jgi:hypothetical protein